MSSTSFQNAMRYPLKLGQVFSYFPIYIGGMEESLQFKWFYWRVGYSLVTFILFVIEFGFVVLDAFETSLSLLNIKVLVFHLGALLQFIMFFRLTYNWPNFVKKWAHVEFHMRTYEALGNLRLKLICILLGIMPIAGVEHGLVNAYKFKNSYDKDPDLNKGFKDFFTCAYSHIFDRVDYSIWLGLLIQRTFYWNYNDVFIMLIGSALTNKIEQVTKKIMYLSKIKAKDLCVWQDLRKDYIRISELCHEVNERLSGVIIMCFFTNMYFTLLQLYSSLRPMESILEKVYFYLSFGLLLLRILCLCVFGGAVYEEWKNIKFYLSTISIATNNPEIAGAIVTYELVLIQFYIKEK